MYPDVKLFIDGQWAAAEGGKTIDVYNPATNEVIGKVASAGKADLDRALAAAERGFKVWRKVSAFERSKVLRRAADLMRERADKIAELLTLEQGKPVGEARMEILSSADLFDWFAEEGRRTYGRVVPGARRGRLPARDQGAGRPGRGLHAVELPGVAGGAQDRRGARHRLLDHRQAAGRDARLRRPRSATSSRMPACPTACSTSSSATRRRFPSYLVPHPIIRKVSFTGSVPVGKHLAALAGQHMKRATMELGGHAPAMVFDDADIDAAAATLAGSKFRNAGQVCVSPTRFLIQEGSYDRFLGKFVEHAQAVKVGDGLD